MKRLYTFWAICLVASIPIWSLVAAPAPKEIEEDTSPVTDEQLRQTMNNLKTMGLAFHIYCDAMNRFPDNIKSKDGKALLSWRVQLLPYLELDQLYLAFKLDEPWDSEHNKKLIEKMPPVYKPVRGKAKANETYYQMFAGTETILTGKKVSFANVVDGTSNTFMIVEAAKPVIWTKPDDIPYDPKKPNAVGGMFPKVFHAVMCDGAARRFSRKIDDDNLRRLIEKADGNVIDVDKLTVKGKGDE